MRHKKSGIHHKKIKKNWYATFVSFFSIDISWKSSPKSPAPWILWISDSSSIFQNQKSLFSLAQSKKFLAFNSWLFCLPSSRPSVQIPDPPFTGGLMSAQWGTCQLDIIQQDETWVGLIHHIFVLVDKYRFAILLEIFLIHTLQPRGGWWGHSRPIQGMRRKNSRIFSLLGARGQVGLFLVMGVR